MENRFGIKDFFVVLLLLIVIVLIVLFRNPLLEYLLK